MLGEFSLDELEFACNLIHNATNLPVFFLNHHKEIKLDYSSNLPYNPIFSSRQNWLKSIDIGDITETFPRAYTTEYLEHFVLIPIVQSNTFYGTIFLGPTAYPEPSESFLNDMIAIYKLEGLDSKIRDYFYTLPISSSWKLKHVSILLSYVILNKKWDIKEITRGNHPLVHLSVNNRLIEKSISILRQNNSYHHDPISEKKVYQYIGDGNKEDLLLYYRAFQQRQDFEFGKLSKRSELRSKKNLKIATITLATRAAISGGLHPEVAYTLGDTYIQRLEELSSVKEVELFVEKVICEFAERVQNNKKQQYSKPIRVCQEYIFKHIYEKLSLSILSDHLSMNPKYLSNLFKKEVGISITEYIQETKIDEAIKIMTFSNYSLSEIPALLNFTDQSYFTKVFKKYTGYTPKKYLQKVTVSSPFF
ncbi:AraC family transcriptional regulator [Fictibacillus enclensis]|uniref:helix-turn-helix domain-containing protein n=1 Tax=Fictibacillus enclensis TaxID=1017270 RepID=UPI0025A0542D|nr:helix-turn-helix domain-containing protein [Fictibacillus enclensis]MDM5337392.1 AraC family transcriptional regulator [Fictibacillus enclensis]